MRSNCPFQCAFCVSKGYLMMSYMPPSCCQAAGHSSRGLVELELLHMRARLTENVLTSSIIQYAAVCRSVLLSSIILTFLTYLHLIESLWGLDVVCVGQRHASRFCAARQQLWPAFLPQSSGDPRAGRPEGSGQGQAPGGLQPRHRRALQGFEPSKFSQRRRPFCHASPSKRRALICILPASFAGSSCFQGLESLPSH